MSKKKIQIKNSKKMNLVQYTGIGLYTLTLATSSLLLLLEPNDLNVKSMIVSVLSLLFVGSLGLSYPIASKKSNKTFAILGTLALAILFTFLGFFFIAGIGWLTALSHV